MREQRPKMAHLTIKLADGTCRSLAIYDAEEWPERNGPHGLLRVQDGERWVSRDGSKYDWHTPEAVGALLAELLREQMGTIEPEPHIAPDTPAGSRVLVRSADDEENVFKTHTRTSPFDRGGQWKVYVVGCRTPLPLECVQLVSEIEKSATFAIPKSGSNPHHHLAEQVPPI
jgi:hypothetical protein